MVGSFTNSNNNLSVFLGDGNGGFGSPTLVNSGGSVPSNVAVADFNGDGDLDIATANYSSDTVSILLGDGDGTTFTQANNSPLGVGNSPFAIAPADFNGDGFLDLAVANFYIDDTVSILLGGGDSTFTEEASSPLGVGNEPISLAVADLNGDGRPDLAVANSEDDNVRRFAPARAARARVGQESCLPYLSESR